VVVDVTGAQQLMLVINPIYYDQPYWGSRAVCQPGSPSAAG
jgi:hypothetical protein